MILIKRIITVKILDPSEVNEYDEYDEYEEHQDKDNDNCDKD